MARRRARIPLSVYMNSRLMGRLDRQSSGAIEFQYDASWLAWEYTMPMSLSLPLREDRFIGEPVVAVFDNLLPDNEAIRRRVAERIGADGYDAYSLLTAIGRDCVGALQFLPEGEEPGPAGRITGRIITDEEIAQKLGDLKQTPLGIDEDEEFRISIAGAQEKTALLYWKGKWHVPHGNTATTHIFKPQIGMLPNGIDLSHSVENEYLCLKLTKALSLPTNEAEIRNFGTRRALVIERFDRQWTRDKRLLRLPQEDCCQALSILPTRKYEREGGPGIQQILDLLQASDEPERDRIFFLKAQLVFWLLGAIDGHAKNFSIHLAPGARFRMAPLYDVMSAQPNVDAGQIRRSHMKLAMAIGEKRHYAIHSILPRHFAQTAARSGISAAAMEKIFDDVAKAAPEGLERSLDSLPASFPETVADSIADGVRARLRLLERAIH